MSAAWLREPNCYICGRSRSRCIDMRIWEEAHGVPDPHEFETLEDAERQASKHQLSRRRDTEARAAAEAARQKSAWQPAPPASDRRVQEPDPEQQEASTA